MLPKMPGVEVLKKMRAQPQLAKIPVIVFTNAHVEAMIQSAMEAGATKVLNKAQTTPHMVIEAFKAGKKIVFEATAIYVERLGQDSKKIPRLWTLQSIAWRPLLDSGNDSRTIPR